MLLFCGVNVPLRATPGWMQAVGRHVPLTHGIEAARAIARGSSLGSVAGLLGIEALIAAAYAALAYGLFKIFEVQGRRSAALETY